MCPQNCKSCAEKIDDEYSYYCFSCIEGYNLNNYDCFDVQCYTGLGSSCLTCDKNEKYRCASCNSGYYLNKTTGTCKKCIANCAKCDDTNLCLECNERYELYLNKCVIGCTKGSNEKCKECNSTSLSECGSCNDRYYLPTDLRDKRECKKCPDNCVHCEGTLTSVTCTECSSSCYSIIKGRCTIDSDKLLNFLLCNDCDSFAKENCLSCKEGSLLVEYAKDAFYCVPCGDNVKKCHLLNNKIIIDECYPGYQIINEQCVGECQKGTKEKCLSCKTERTKINQCKECNKGYFLPTDYEKQDICFLCLSEGCVKCTGTITNNICIECNNNYKLYEGNCIQICDVGDDSKCLTCSDEPGKNNRCGTCNELYYLPTYSTDSNQNLICKKCPDKCLSCYGDYDEPICSECKSGYILRKGICIEGCEYMRGCLTCDDSGDFPRCTTCYEGFYFPKNLNKYYDRCYSCSLPGCKKCEGLFDYDDYCLECKSEYDSVLNDDNIVVSCSKSCEIGIDNKCKSCSLDDSSCGSCNEGYVLEGGVCLSKNYDIIAEYETQNADGFITLLNSYCIDYMNFNGVDYESYPFNFIRAGKPGIYKAFIKLNRYCNYPYLFADNKYIKKLTFFDNFNANNIDLMNEGFYNSPNLEYIDLSNLHLENNRCFMNYFANDEKLKEVRFPKTDVKNAFYLNGMFKNCKSITSIDLSTLYNDGVHYTDDMFSGCSSLQSIKINKFKNVQVLSNNLMNGLPEKGTIAVSKEIEEFIKKQIPKNWAVEVD